MSVLLHIGWQKTGTTSIQYFLRDHEALLAEHGARFPRGWLRLNNHFELPLTLLRLDRMMTARYRADEWRSATWRAEVLGQVSDDLATHPDELNILSAEALSLFRYDDEFIPLRSLVGDAVIVAYLRDPVDYLASSTAHYCKEGMPGVSDDPAAFNYMRPDSWRVDYETLLDGWRRHFTDVRALDYDAAVAEDESVVPSFLRQLGIPVPADAYGYRLNGRLDEVPRAEGNRLTTGERFGVG